MQAFACSYLEHSRQNAAFKAPADSTGTGYHSGGHIPCTVSLTLHGSSHVGRTIASNSDRHVRGFRLVMVSDPLGDRFQGLEYRSCSLTHPVRRFPDSAPSLLRFTGKGSMPLSSLSFSRSAFSADPRRLSLPRLVGLATARLPTPARVTRTLRALHPIDPKGFGHVSHGGIWKSPSSPALNQTTPPNCTAEPFPFARIPGCPAHEIESEDYSRLVAGDYSQKPLSNVAGHSRGTTLYGTCRDGW